MEPKRSQMLVKQAELLERRKELHGQRRKLHERLSEVCEEFVLSDISREHKQTALMGELQYLLDYYRDDTSWEGIRWAPR